MESRDGGRGAEYKSVACTKDTEHVVSNHKKDGSKEITTIAIFNTSQMCFKDSLLKIFNMIAGWF